MEKFKRFLAVIVMILSSLGCILGLAGIFGVWLSNTPLTEDLTGALDSVETVLVFSQDRMELILTNLTTVQNTFASLDETITAANENLTENSPTLTLLSNTIGKDLKPKIEATAEVVATIRATVISVNSTLETINQMPFVSVPTLPLDELVAIDERVQEGVTSVKSLSETIKEIEAGMLTRTTSAIMEPVEQLSEKIIQVKTPLDEFSNTLNQTQVRVANVNAQIPKLIDWGSIIVTIVLSWFILSQVSLFYGGWYFWKTGRLPTIQNPS